MRAADPEMTAARRTQVLMMRAAGLTLRQIAAQVGLSAQSVNIICHADENRKSQQAEAAERIASGDSRKVLFRDLEMSVRTRNVVTNLLGNDVTVAGVAMLSDARLLREPNFGKTSLNELKSALAKFGLQLGLEGSLEYLDERATHFMICIHACLELGIPADEIEERIKALVMRTTLQP